ncbi:MAG: head-tail connector protein [Proteobacteria bacterium]|nr:head-tail connector protein [Pseudomonadota bacterium]
MSVTPLTPPADEPLSLAAARAWLRVDGEDEDALITALVAASRETVETLAGRRLMAQGWRITRDSWPEDGCIRLPLGPVLALDAVRLIDAQGAAMPLPLAAFRLDGNRQPPLIETIAMVPAPVLARGGIEIDVTCGFGANPDDVPEALRQAMRLLIAHWFENRGDAASRNALPEGVGALVAPFRMPRL